MPGGCVFRSLPCACLATHVMQAAEYDKCSVSEENELYLTSGGVSLWEPMALPFVSDEDDAFRSLADELIFNYLNPTAPDGAVPAGASEVLSSPVNRTTATTSTSQQLSQPPRRVAEGQKRRGGRHGASREAQRRAEIAHRQRKAARQLQLQSTLAAMAAEAERSSVVNQSLQRKVRILETCLRLRDDYLNGQYAAPVAAPDAANLQVALRGACLPLPAQHGMAGSQQLGSSRSSGYDPALHLVPYLSASSGDQQQLQLLSGAISFWRTYVSEAMPFVLEGSRNGGQLTSGSQAQLRWLSERTTESGRCLMQRLRPASAALLLTTSLEDGRPMAPEFNWHAVAAAAEFTTDQKQEFAAVYAAFSSRVSVLRAERARLQAQLDALTADKQTNANLGSAAAADAAAAANFLSVLDSPSSSLPTARQPHNVVSDVLVAAAAAAATPVAVPPLAAGCASSLDEVAAALELNFRLEGVERQILEAYPVHMTNYTPLQMAKLAVAAYPYMPSADTIFRAMHAEVVGSSAYGTWADLAPLLNK